MANGLPAELLSTLDAQIKKEFESNRRVLSFDEYIHLLSERPAAQLRGSAQYAVDMIEHFGRSPLPTGADAPARLRVFDEPEDSSSRKVIGHEEVQNRLFQSFKTFSRQGLNNKLVLLHGPNGSAKSSMIQSVMSGMERYSKTDDGAVYTFNWVFPVDKITKGSIGLQGSASKSSYSGAHADGASYAKLEDEEVQARIPCDMRDHPLLLIPLEHRRAFLAKAIGAQKAEDFWARMPQYLTRGNLCHRCKMIFEAMLAANGGDFRKVMMHVQVERFFYSRRYRKGLVTIEPQMHVDAQYQMLTYNKSMGSLPPALQGLNLFALSGDIIEGNRGIVEYSDLLKRPIDSYKYLLMTCESASVNIGNTIAYFDVLWLGSTNELQLDAFKEFPDFTSFKARIDLVRVPYLLSVTQEQEIYKQDLEQLKLEKPVAPHVGWTVALWAVLTRLKKPNSINYPPHISSIVSHLSPLDKAKLYDTGEMPVNLPPEERKLLRSSIRKIRDEYQNIPYYEGRMGASAREIRSILALAAQNPDFPSVSPLAVMREMEEFVKRVSEYEFLKQDVKDGYHDAHDFISVVRNEYLQKIDREVRDSMGLYDSGQWEEFLRKYVTQISALLKKEKVKNPITAKMEDPDTTLVEEFEKIVDAPAETAARDSFRQNVISTVGVWSLDHPKEPMVYARVFPEFWAKLEKHYYESQKALLTKMHNALKTYDKDPKNVTEEGLVLARQTVANLVSKQGYTEESAKEVITFLMKQRY